VPSEMSGVEAAGSNRTLAWIDASPSGSVDNAAMPPPDRLDVLAALVTVLGCLALTTLGSDSSPTPKTDKDEQEVEVPSDKSYKINDLQVGRRNHQLIISGHLDS
jgi:hypothetical protein